MRSANTESARRTSSAKHSARSPDAIRHGVRKQPRQPAMTYYVEKQLAFGPIRFGVATRRSLDAIGDDLTLSTGPNGEFIRRREDGFFFGDTERVVGPSLPVKPTINQTPFWSSLKPDGSSRGYLFLILMALGALIMLLGVTVLVRKGPQGWFEII